MVRLAQISDLHIPRPSAKHAQEFETRLRDCIARVNALAPDAVIATGDLTDTGSEEEYRSLRELMSRISAPYYLTPGNHDDRTMLRRVYRDHAYLFQSDGHTSYAVDLSELRLLVLDSTKPGRAGGFVDEARLAWLDSQLKRSATPTLLALHHPPFAAGVWPLDWLGFTNIHALEEVIRMHPHVRRIISGHVHCARTAKWGGTLACTSPSTKPQRLVLGRRWQAPKLHVEAAGFLLHTSDKGEIVSCVHRTDGGVQTLSL